MRLEVKKSAALEEFYLSRIVKEKIKQYQEII